MKRNIAFVLTLIIIICGFFTGCGKTEKADMVVNLALAPTNTDYGVSHIEVKENIDVDFILPNDGYLKLIVYDATEYEEWPDQEPDKYVTFTDENGKKLTEELLINGGYTDKIKFKKGRITAKIRFDKYIKEMNAVSICWAFAPDTDEAIPVWLDNNRSFAARVDKDGKAKFSFYADYDAVYNFFCGEACVPESDCEFYIEDENGQKITGDINIHGTEWAWRRVFLPAGQYTITVFNDTVSAVAECNVVMEKEYDEVVFEQDGELSLPVNFGFNAICNKEKTVKFTADGTSKKLVITADGSGNYYEYGQEYTLQITDKNGKVLVFEDDAVMEDDRYSGNQTFDLTGIKGELTVTVQSSDACVINISIK